MRKQLFILALAFSVLALGAATASAEGPGDEMKGSAKGSHAEPKGSGHEMKGSATDKYATAQSAMDAFINSHTCAKPDKCKLGDMEAEFDYLHDGVKEKDGYLVSCADFKVGDDVYDVDYYVEDKNGKFKVKKEVLHKKNGEAINKELWPKSEVEKSDSKGKGSGTEEKGSGYMKKGS